MKIDLSNWSGGHSCGLMAMVW